MLAASRSHQSAALLWFERARAAGLLQVEPVADYEGLARTIAQYADLPCDYADASLIALAEASGVTADKIAVVRNSADIKGFTPGPKPEDLLKRHGLEGKFIAAYIGTIGMAHGLGTILAAAERMKVDAGIAFLLVGDGAEREALERQARECGLDNVIFAGSVGKADVLRYWRLSDASLVLLRDRPVFRHVLPSKMFEAMATQTPIVLGVLGESAELLQRAGAGIVIQPESAEALEKAILQLAGNREAAAEMGRKGRRFVEAEFDRDKLAAMMLEELRSVAAR